MTGKCLLNPDAKKTEHFQSSQGLDSAVQKNSALIDLTKLSKDADKLPRLLVHSTSATLHCGCTDGQDRQVVLHFSLALWLLSFYSHFACSIHASYENLLSPKSEARRKTGMFHVI